MRQLVPAALAACLTADDVHVRAAEDVDGDIGLQYKFEPGRMVYVSASKGSKGGGFQNAPTTVAGAPYSGETAYTVEAGGKLLNAFG